MKDALIRWLFWPGIELASFWLMIRIGRRLVNQWIRQEEQGALDETFERHRKSA